ncbi:MAG TPA: DUF1203 domain-containing protein [Pyrinomonadaceae bacterium]|nr:DUF1203 domain-containing protein [Pyrinomonadaceae bacterium]
MNYEIKPIPNEIASSVRETLVSPQYKSLIATVSIADGYGPCRSCLQVFDQGTDHRIYFTYNSFEGRSDLPDPGPVFIHRNECTAFSGSGFPPDLLDLPVLYEAFGDQSRLISRTAMQKDAPNEQIASIFADPAVRFINLRNAEAGCFIATVER